MPASQAKTIRLEDYTPPAYWVDRVDLAIDFLPELAVVRCQLSCRKNAKGPGGPLILDGSDLETDSIAIDSRLLNDGEYTISETHLTIDTLPDAFTLETVVRIDPDRNTRLSGLYRCQDGYVTQCEAEGFRRITWFPDRPDVMSVYTVTLRADHHCLPVLLANGNPVASGSDGQSIHWARWEDPFPKPCYLFAVVAGKLDVLRDVFVTRSGRDVQLAIYVEPGKLDQCGHAMAALKKAMAWDEVRFGLECDLDYYHIVAVGDFNMGAMENKGLNIFNTKYVLARSDLATDTDFEHIDRVVAHEYFHNWTGNRVTCRDWFQLSLKEGLTVYRDQEFGADVHDKSVARIREVRTLRAVQFPEDAGPMAHPVRPSSYIEINNFYTATVYEKGAELVRMMATLVGEAGFRRGMDEYFRRHDGQAVTCEDFVAAIAAGAGPDVGLDAQRFISWYRQPGTPCLTVNGHYDAPLARYRLEMRQENPQAKDAGPLILPLKVALFLPDGSLCPGSARTLRLEESTQSFIFEGVPALPVLSVLRDFSAPVRLDLPQRNAELTLLLAHEPDSFAAWEASQRLYTRLILAAGERLLAGQEAAWPDDLLPALMRLLATAEQRGRAFVAEALTLPGESTLAEFCQPYHPDALHAARLQLRQYLGRGLAPALRALLDHGAPAPFSGPEAVAARALKNVALALLVDGQAECRQLAARQYHAADNMTDRYAALAALAQEAGEDTEVLLDDFLSRYRDEALVVDKWLAVQAASRREDTLARVMALCRGDLFTRSNPNKVYALLRTFGANLACFHAADGAGYRFLAGEIAAVDALNPQVAARLARSFDILPRLEPRRQALARVALGELAAHPRLSRDVAEILGRLLTS